MITTEELKKMPEIQVIRIIKNPDTNQVDYNRAAEFLIKKYENMIHKHWWMLQKQMNKSGYVNALKDDYYDEAYEALFKAIQKVDTDRIYDEKFKLLQLASWYIGNVRRKFIKEIIKKESKKKSIVTVALEEDEDSNVIDSDVEKSYTSRYGYKDSPVYQYEIKEGEENCYKSIDECFKIWSKDEKKIYKMLENGKSKAEIAQYFEVKPTKIYSITNKMSKDLKRAMNYDEVRYSYS